MLLNTGSVPVESKNGLITTVGFKIEDRPPVYCLEGSVANAGSLVQWMRDNLKMINSSAEIEALAREVPDNGDVYIVPAFSGLFAPYWRADARGIIAGLTRFSNRGHLARAVLEATAFQTMEVVEAMKKDSGVDLSMLKVDGGMTVNELLMQFQADILEVPIVRPVIRETTALGAAYGAGLEIGYWHSLDELKSKWAADREWKPQIEPEKKAKLCARWKSRHNPWVGSIRNHELTNQPFGIRLDLLIAIGTVFDKINMIKRGWQQDNRGAGTDIEKITR